MVMLQEREGRQLLKECFAYGDSIADRNYSKVLAILLRKSRTETKGH